MEPDDSKPIGKLPEIPYRAPIHEPTDILPAIPLPSLNVIKVVVIGDGLVGKTSLLCRYTQDKFDVQHFTTM